MKRFSEAGCQPKFPTLRSQEVSYRLLPRQRQVSFSITARTRGSTVARAKNATSYHSLLIFSMSYDKKRTKRFQNDRPSSESDCQPKILALRSGNVCDRFLSGHSKRGGPTARSLSLTERNHAQSCQCSQVFEERQSENGRASSASRRVACRASEAENSGVGQVKTAESYNPQMSI